MLAELTQQVTDILGLIRHRFNLLSERGPIAAPAYWGSAILLVYCRPPMTARGPAMFRPIIEMKCCLTILAVLTFATPALPQEVTASNVDKAIQETVRFLLGAQLPDGGWPEFSTTFPAGVSSLVTLSLLNSGLDPETPTMSRALRHLAEQELDKVYTVSLQTMAFCAANPTRYAAQIERNAIWLAECQQDHGGWAYDKQRGGGDPSNSQFALLALHEAQRSGTRLTPARWKEIFDKAHSYWEKLQNQDGSFSYTSSERTGRGSMTCAGIASLIIVGSQLEQLEASGEGEIACCGRQIDNEDRIRRAMKWMGDNFSVKMHPGSGSIYHLYYLYALERAGRMTGQRFIGQHDWYREGVEQIIRVMHDKIRGSILPSAGNFQGNEYSETAFGLLFLAKGKRQIVVSRLKYGNDNDWDHHSTAIQNLTTHTEQAWKRELAWQTIDLSRATVEDLLETPVLYISGSRAPNFSAPEKQRLKDYVEQGGFIFAEANHGNGCDGRAFENYFSQLVIELFDQPLDKIAPDHPIWFAQSRVNPSDLKDGAWLYGVQTCCRLGVVYYPISLTCRWELNLPYGVRPDFGERIQSELDTATKIGINVLAYATGKELKEKLDTVTILEEVVQETSTDRGLFVLPVLRHNAGADDAPRAIPNLIEWLDKENPFQMSSEKRLINIVTSELEQYAVVFMHGRGELRLNDDQREALRKYLQNGGFLFADAICADEPFVASFRREIGIILGDELERVPETHPMLSRKYYGYDIRQVEVIDPDRSGDSIISVQRKGPPMLEFANVNNRVAVVFSPLDLSCALESRHSLQCRGYIRPDAAKIGINVILFALQN